MTESTTPTSVAEVQPPIILDPVQAAWKLAVSGGGPGGCRRSCTENAENEGGKESKEAHDVLTCVRLNHASALGQNVRNSARIVNVSSENASLL